MNNEENNTPPNRLRTFMTDLRKGDIHTYAFLFLLIYVSIMNLFVFTAEATLVVLQFLLLILLFYKKDKSTFIKDWLPFIAAFILFEFLRAQVDDITPFYHSFLYAVYDLEMNIFQTIPTIFLQRHLLHYDWILQISTVFYISYFYYSFVVGFLIWLFKRKIFNTYFIGFMTLSFIGVVIHFFFPTAPPWFAQLEGISNIERILWDRTIIGSLQGIQVFHYFDRSNYVAALPSLHTGWTAYTSFFLMKHWGKKAIITFIIPLMVAFSVVLTGEHFLIDIILGIGLAYLTVNNFFRRGLELSIRQLIAT